MLYNYIIHCVYIVAVPMQRVRCQANMAHTRHSGPDFGLDFQEKVLETFQVVPASPGGGNGTIANKGHSNSHGARPVHLIITMIKWIRTSRLPRKNSLSGWQLQLPWANWAPGSGLNGVGIRGCSRSVGTILMFSPSLSRCLSLSLSLSLSRGLVGEVDTPGLPAASVYP